MILKLILAEIRTRKYAFIIMALFLIAPFITIFIKGTRGREFSDLIYGIRLNLFFASTMVGAWPMGLMKKVENKVKIYTNLPINRKQIINFRSSLIILVPVISMLTYNIAISNIPLYEYTYLRILESILIIGMVMIIGFGQFITIDLIAFSNEKSQSYLTVLSMISSGPGIIFLFATITSMDRYLTLHLLNENNPNLLDYSILCYSILAIGIIYGLFSRKIYLKRADYLRYFKG